MHLTISGHHIDLTDPLRDYVTEKLSKLSRHHDQITTTNVILSVEKLIHKAEATVHVSGADLFATADSNDLYAAIDSLVDKLDRQLIRHKEKIKAH